jgi:hypothetical protein
MGAKRRELGRHVGKTIWIARLQAGQIRCRSSHIQWLRIGQPSSQGALKALVFQGDFVPRQARAKLRMFRPLIEPRAGKGGGACIVLARGTRRGEACIGIGKCARCLFVNEAIVLIEAEGAKLESRLSY